MGAVDRILKLYLENISSRTHISVDVQEEHESSFTFDVSEYYEWMVEKFDTNIVYFNGPELGFYDTQGHIFWLLEQGVSEEIIDQIDFREKGYAFFRSCIDQGIEECLVFTIQYMVKNNITDSRDMTLEHWEELTKLYPNECDDIRDFLFENEDMINIPDTYFEIRDDRLTNCVVTGGGRNECLEEVRLILESLNVDYSYEEEYVY